MNPDTPTIPRDRTSISDSSSNQNADVSIAANSRENNPLKTRTDTKEPEVLDLSVPIEKPSASNMQPEREEPKPSESDRRDERPEEKRPGRESSDEPKHPPEDLGPRPDPGAEGPARPIPFGENPYRRPGEPRVETIRQGNHSWRETTWTDGPNAGTVQRDYPDGTRLVFKPHPDGGQIATSYDQHGNPTSSTRTHMPGPDGSIRVDHTNHRNPRNSYSATHHTDGSLNVEYGDGSRFQQRYEYVNGRRVLRTTGTGPSPHHNFTATETPDSTGGSSLDVRYQDGSRYQRHVDGREETTGSRGGLGVLDRLLGSAADQSRLTRVQLNILLYMTESRDLAQVRRLSRR